jgi:YidC/Oxa1 family membrane protein insertase
MKMIFFFYTLIIFPLVQLIELAYLFVYRVFESPGIAILGVSIVVSIGTLPLYFIAEKHQQTERDIQKRLKPKIDKIKKVFRGDEQYLILSTYYRQNHYHPVYALRNTFGLLIQIPFFIAAYSYLSHLKAIQSISFFFIKNLGTPDGLLSIGDFNINILPIVMTLINCISGTVYAKGLGLKDKVQIYGMSILFLLLLYNSPSGLVLYWTMNNIFSLGKNILHKTEKSKKILYFGLCFFVFLLDIYLLFFHSGYIIKRILICIASSVVFFMPILSKAAVYIREKIDVLFLENVPICQKRTFIFSSISLVFLIGLVIPGSLIASSVQEFSFIESYTSPFPFLIHTLLQAAGIFLFWPFCIYSIFPKSVKILLTIFLTLILVIGLVNTFLFPGDYGFLTPTLVFSNPTSFISDLSMALINIFSLILISLFVILLIISKKKNVFYSIQIITLLTMGIFSVINNINIYRGFSTLVQDENDGAETPDTVYTFSKTGKNVLVIMLDRGISLFVPSIFEEKPELFDSFSGFTWFPNCVSFAGYTFIGAPPLFGGYDYTPMENSREHSETLLDRYREAYSLMPSIFSANNYSVVVTDPPYEDRLFVDTSSRLDLNMYRQFPSTRAANIQGKYTAYWLKQHPDIKIISIAGILKNNLVRFSIFRISPIFFKMFIYDHSRWLTTVHFNSKGISGSLGIRTIDNYAVLDLLPEITKIESGGDTFTIMVNDLTHEPAFLNVPDYTPSQIITSKGNGPFAEESYYHVNTAALLLLGKWFDYMKKNGIYDNTRIIIVSDHGSTLSIDYQNNFLLPDGNSQLQNYNPLLMVKDFDALGILVTNNSFMTNADVPFLATNNIIENPKNPFTGSPLQNKKANEAIVTNVGMFSGHARNKLLIRSNQWFHVHDNIFDPENWTAVQVQP